MSSPFWQPVRAVAVAALAFAIPHAVLHGQSQTSGHVVSPLELQKAEQSATTARQQNIDALKGFLNTPAARQTMQKAHVDPVQVQKAIAGLSDQELAQLAARATKAQNEFAAGTLSNQDMMLLLIFLVALILIIVAVR